MSNGVKASSAKPLNSGVKVADLTEFFTLAEGSDREVLESTKFANVVVKIAHDKKSEVSAQVCELKNWTQMCKEGYAHLVPAHDVLYKNGKMILVVERVELVTDQYMTSDECFEMKISESFAGDMVYGVNCGHTTDGRFLVLDAGCVPETEHFDEFEFESIDFF